MKQYRIFEHPIGTTEAIKIGWSWPALSFSIFWALAKKMWWVAIGGALFLFASDLLVSLFFKKSDPTELINYCLALIMWLIFGAKGNSWREGNLLDRGFDHVDTVTAANKDGAVALYLKSKQAEGGPGAPIRYGKV